MGVSTRGPWWGHLLVVLGAILSFLEPFCRHLSPKIDKVSEKLTLRYPHEGPCVGAVRTLQASAPCLACSSALVLERRQVTSSGERRTTGYEPWREKDSRLRALVREGQQVTSPCKRGTNNCEPSALLRPDAKRERRETEFFIDNLLVRIHLTIEMITVNWPCAMGV